MPKFEVYIEDEFWQEFRKGDIFGKDRDADAQCLSACLVMLISPGRKDPDTIPKMVQAQKIKVTKLAEPPPPLASAKMADPTPQGPAPPPGPVITCGRQIYAPGRKDLKCLLPLGHKSPCCPPRIRP